MTRLSGIAWAIAATLLALALPAAAGAAPVPPIRAKGKAAKTLRRKGRAKVTASVTFTPTGGSAGTETRKLTLKRDR